MGAGARAGPGAQGWIGHWRPSQPSRPEASENGPRAPWEGAAQCLERGLPARQGREPRRTFRPLGDVYLGLECAGGEPGRGRQGQAWVLLSTQMYPNPDRKGGRW